MRRHIRVTMASEHAVTLAWSAPTKTDRTTRKSAREARSTETKVRLFVSDLNKIKDKTALPQTKWDAVGLAQALEAVEAIELDDCDNIKGARMTEHCAATVAACVPRVVGEIAKAQAALERRKASAVLTDAQATLLERLMETSAAILHKNRVNKLALETAGKRLEAMYDAAEKASRPTSRAVLSRALPDALALPDELWLRIFEMVGPCLSFSAYVVPQVCRHWRELWDIRRSAIVGNVRLWDAALSPSPRVSLVATHAPRPEGVFFHERRVCTHELPNQERFAVFSNGMKWPEKVHLDGWALVGPVTAVDGDPGAVYTFGVKNARKHTVYVKGSEVRSIRDVTNMHSDAIMLPNGVLVGVDYVDLLTCIILTWGVGDDVPITIGNIVYIGVRYAQHYEEPHLLRYCDGEVSAVATPRGVVQDIFVDYEDKKRPRLVLVMADADSVWASSRVEGEEEWVSLPSAKIFPRVGVGAWLGRTKSGRTLLRIKAFKFESEQTLTYAIQ